MALQERHQHEIEQTRNEIGQIFFDFWEARMEESIQETFSQKQRITGLDTRFQEQARGIIQIQIDVMLGQDRDQRTDGAQRSNVAMSWMGLQQVEEIARGQTEIIAQATKMMAMLQDERNYSPDDAIREATWAHQSAYTPDSDAVKRRMKAARNRSFYVASLDPLNALFGKQPSAQQLHCERRDAYEKRQSRPNSEDS
jgi:hypothetical protein